METPQAIVDLFRSDDVNKRVHAYKNLTIVMETLGPERTRSELLPCLEELVDDDSKALAELAEQLGNMVDFIGPPAYAPLLLKALEVLIGSDEHCVRHLAAKALLRVASVLTSSDNTAHIMPLIKRLVFGEFFNSKAAACIIIPGIYSKVNFDEKEILRGYLLSELCVEPNAVVRRAACTEIPVLAEIFELEYVKKDLLLACERSCKDSQTSVRLLLPKACLEIARAVRDDPDNDARVLAILETLARDKSWRVRCTTASAIPELIEELQREPKAQDKLLKCYSSFVHDAEPEVRHAASRKLEELGKRLLKTKSKTVNMSDLEDRLLQIVQSFKSDDSTYVRASFASNVGSVCSLLAKSHGDELVSVMCTLLQDQESEVRLNTIGSLDENFDKAIGVSRVSAVLLAGIKDLAVSPDWRKRMALISYMPGVCRQLGAEFFQENLSSMCMDCLGDSVYSVRHAVTKQLAKLAKLFGPDWAKQHLIPKFISLTVHRSYIYRMMALTAAEDMAASVGTTLATSHLLVLVVSLLEDPVSNVRIHVAKTLGSMLMLVEENAVHSVIGPKLLILAGDTDVDVRYYACVAIEEMNNVNAEDVTTDNDEDCA